jgi:hypothetical protein
VKIGAIVILADKLLFVLGVPGTGIFLKKIQLLMDKIIKIFLAILFFLCSADMPYSYYQFVRFASLIGFAILAFQANEHSRQTEIIIYSVLALLFQPFFKIALGRQIWNIVDVVVGIGLIISTFMKPKKN